MSNMFKKVGKIAEFKASIVAPQHGGLKFVLSTVRIDGKLDNVLLDTFAKRWFQYRAALASMYAARTGAFKMGFIKETAVQSDVWLQQMVCVDESGKLDLAGLKVALKSVLKAANAEHASVHVSSLLTKAYPQMTDAINEEIAGNGVNVCYYSEPNS